MPTCKECGFFYTDEAMIEYEAAPNWDNECPSCTRRKFAQFLNDYLLKIVTPEILHDLALKYFGEPTRDSISKDRQKLVSDIIALVDDGMGRHDVNDHYTPGKAIAAFVDYFQREMRKIDQQPEKKKIIQIVLLVVMLGALFIALAISIYIFDVFAFNLF